MNENILWQSGRESKKYKTNNRKTARTKQKANQ